MFVMYQPNPANDGVGDCAVRAVAKVLGTTWEDAYTKLTMNGFLMGDMPSSDAVIASVLRQNGFYREAIPNTCPDCYTAEDFCRDNPQGTYVLGFGGHVATIQNGVLYDSWDSSNEVPVYYWYRKE